ncbi:MAG TPA: GlsB/YeaQ/YmgE family stress response membrane protein [Pirellulaceae bacterium]|nr:GlsB/YeaQ/YmgE family stress response membrane protein [Pirellulaceae bacterium]
MSLIYSVISWAVFGLVIGAIARFILPGKQSMSLLMTMLLGVVGSFVGGGIAHLFGSGTGYVQPAGWIMSIVGAFILLAVYSYSKTKKAA